MDYTWISFAGIILAIAAFIFLQSKSIGTLISAVIAAVIIALTSGMSINDTMFTTWGASFGNFANSNFLRFVLAAIIGKLYSDSGAARRIALGVSKICGKSKKNKAFFSIVFVYLMYIIMNYIGMNGFVIIFTVIYIAKELFEANDVPWIYYAFGGSGACVAICLAGSLNLVNIVLAEMCGTTTSSGALFSIAYFVFFSAIYLICIKLIVDRAQKRGSHFADTGAAFAASITNRFEDESLPGLGISLIPLAVMILMTSVFNIDVRISLLAAIILAILLFRKNLEKPMGSVGQGLNTGVVAFCNIAAITAMISVMLYVPGYQVFTNALTTMSSVTRGVVSMSLITLISGAPITAVTTVGAETFALFTGAGLSPAVSHRLMETCFWGTTAPWSSGVANFVVIGKVDYKKVIPVYLVGIACLFVSMIVFTMLALTGIFG